MGTTVKKCTCTAGLAAAFQDERYGKGMRVHNLRKGSGASCTCCGKDN